MPHRICWTVRTGAAFLLLLVWLVGCREVPVESRKAGVFPLQPKPVTVAVTQDSARSERATIPAGGGTLTAVGSDGSRFTLTIPPKALDGDTTITMTPVSGMAKLPLSGGLVAAVHLEPEGLRFNTPAVLRIEPAREVPVQQQVGFGYLGGGDDLHLYPLDRGRALSMRLLHFSGVGVGAGSQADVQALQHRPPADAAAQLEQQIAAPLNAERGAQLTGGPADPTLSTDVTQLLEDFYDHVILPKLDAAKATDDWRVLFDAIQTAVAFARMSAMVGEDAPALAKLLPILEPILVRGFDRAYYHCLQKIGGEKEARLLMVTIRHAALTIFGVDPSGPRFSEHKVEQCFAGGATLPRHLELSFEATFVFEEQGVRAQMTAGSTMRLESGGSTIYYTKGWTPIVYHALQFTAGSGCPSYTNVKLHDGMGKIDLFVHPDGRIGASVSYNAVPFPGWPTEELTRVECDGRSVPWKDAWWWMHGLEALQRTLTLENPPGYVGIPTGMTLSPEPGILSATIERTNFDRRYKKGVIKLGLKALP